MLRINFQKFACLSILSLFYANLSPSHSTTYVYEGKCGFLLQGSYQERCKAIFSKGKLMLLSKNAPTTKILPQQILKVSNPKKSISTIIEKDSSTELWKKYFDVNPKDKLKKGPSWLREDKVKEITNHRYSIRFVTRDFQPRIVLFVLEDQSKAAAMGQAIQNFTGMRIGQTREINNSLDSKLATKYIRESNRISQRLIGYCSAKMYEEARPIARKLNAYVNNSIDDIAIFSDIDRTISALYLARDKAVAFCDNKLLADVQKANEKKQADEISKLEEDRLKREEAFEMLSSF